MWQFPERRIRPCLNWPVLSGLIVLMVLAAPLPALAQTGQQPGAAFKIPAFQVEVVPSPRAAARLAELREGVVVAAYYYGDPAPGFTKRADEMGQINLGAEQVTLAGVARTATLTGRTLLSGRVGWVKDRNIQVLINVYSARRSGPDNLLNCGIFEDTVSVAASVPIRIPCKLITEGP